MRTEVNECVIVDRSFEVRSDNDDFAVAYVSILSLAFTLVPKEALARKAANLPRGGLQVQTVTTVNAEVAFPAVLLGRVDESEVGIDLFLAD